MQFLQVFSSPSYNFPGMQDINTNFQNTSEYILAGAFRKYSINGCPVFLWILMLLFSI